MLAGCRKGTAQWAEDVRPAAVEELEEEEASERVTRL